MQENLYEKILRCLNNDEALYMRKLTIFSLRLWDNSEKVGLNPILSFQFFISFFWKMFIKVNLDSPIEGLSKFTLTYLKNSKYIIHNCDYINCYCKSIQAPAYKK